MVFNSPCELGDEVWIIDDNKLLHGIVEEFTIRRYGTYCQGSLYRDENNDGDDYDYEFGVDVKNFGKTVFLNKELAEKTLAEKKKGV